MHVLMISLDASLLDDTMQMGDSRPRHVAYAQALAEQRPGSTLHILVRARPTPDASAVALAANLWLYPTGNNGLTFVIEAFKRVRQISARLSFDLITTQTPFLDGLVGCLLKWWLKIPLLVQLHISRPGDAAWLKAQVSNRLRLWLARGVMRLADGIRVNTQRSADWLAHTWGVPVQKIHVNPVSPVRLVLDPAQKKSERPTVLYVGRLAHEKGVDILLKAFAQVVATVPQAQLLVVGDGPERESLQALATQLALDETQVIFTGAVSPAALAAYYQPAWLVALPSRHESFGRVILEAFSAGRPVVATNTEGARSLISPELDGLVVPGEDTEALAGALLRLLQQPELADAMGRRAGQKAEPADNSQHLRQALINIWLTVAGA